MSVIVAIKENGVVYMGADSQTTTGRRKRNGLNETAYKITRLENGMLVGFCGKVAAKQAILSMEDVFVLDKEGGLNKKHIVKEIVPKLVDKMQLIGDEDSGALDVSILLAYKDKLYRITSGLDVLNLNECGRSGAGADFTNWYLFGEKNLSIRERILKALVASARRAESVGGPYVLIDTQKQEFEVVDMGGNNH
jgi:ATP-dependent protease HslVU (ClpYQ) peptidase subunit